MFYIFGVCRTDELLLAWDDDEWVFCRQSRAYTSTVLADAVIEGDGTRSVICSQDYIVGFSGMQGEASFWIFEYGIVDGFHAGCTSIIGYAGMHFYHIVAVRFHFDNHVFCGSLLPVQVLNGLLAGVRVLTFL